MKKFDNACKNIIKESTIGDAKDAYYTTSDGIEKLKMLKVDGKEKQAIAKLVKAFDIFSDMTEWGKKL